MQQTTEMMHDVGTVLAGRVEFARQGEERTRVVVEIVDVEDGLGVWNLVLLQIVVESRAWRSEKIGK